MDIRDVIKAGNTAIEAIDLVKDYGSGSNAVHALRGVNVAFEQGRFTAIMGPSGSGKSTLMHTLAGLDSATSGHIMFDGDDLTRMDDEQLTLLRRHQIGFIFQSFNLLPMFTAEQNIVMPLTLPARSRTGLVRSARRNLGTQGTAQPSSERTVRRPAAARRHRTRADYQAEAGVRRRADRQPRLRVQRGSLGFLKRSVNELGQTIVMVTHDAVAASYATARSCSPTGRSWRT